MPSHLLVIAAVLSLLGTEPAYSVPHASFSAGVRVVQAARQLLQLANLPYVFGGHVVGAVEDCEACSYCLEKHAPAPKVRIKTCPVCSKCSLDCSHFTQLAFKMAGLEHPYLPTELMISLSRQTLRQRYRLLDIGRSLAALQPGDLLVYQGHVAMVEVMRGLDKVDVIHATAGRDLKTPSQGVQRERFVTASNFRGPLLRILRHVDLVPSEKRLRPVARRAAPVEQGD